MFAFASVAGTAVAFFLLGALAVWWMMSSSLRRRQNGNKNDPPSVPYPSSLVVSDDRNDRAPKAAPSLSLATKDAEQKTDEGAVDTVCLDARLFSSLMKTRGKTVHEEEERERERKSAQRRRERQIAFDRDLYLRDKRVLNDQLYPPLNRPSADVLAHLPPSLVFDRRMPDIDFEGKNCFAGGRRVEDKFRLLGYLKANPGDDGAKDAGNNVWKCMGRMKDRNSGEFYAVPANANDDIKIPLTPDTIARNSERFRDLYTLPSEVRFNSPFFHATPYTFVELPKADLPAEVYV